MISCNDTVLGELLQFETPPAGNIVRIPSLLWRRLKYDVRDHVRERQLDGKLLVSWRHGVFAAGRSSTATHRRSFCVGKTYCVGCLLVNLLTLVHTAKHFEWFTRDLSCHTVTLLGS